uniref:Reverse transcriptase domain-containing protein n=1 Tax=Tanacetum cinerariifolium TaxID=118510 RepID=A0A6L2LM12_TANCI|nr:reverse transcriptase domain-containing protein [Tanacetum cinerariifolium]
MKMEHYLSHTEYPIWQVLQNGNGPVYVTTDTNGMIKVLPHKTAKEVMARERERKARTTLLMDLPEDYLEKFHKMADAKEMRKAIKSRFGGNNESKKMQKYFLKQQFEGFSVSASKGLHKGYDRHYCIIIIKNTKCGFVSTDNTSSTNDISTAYIVSSPSVSKSQKEGSSSYTDEVIHSFFANQSSAPQLDYDDLEQINDDDMEEMDLKWQLVLIRPKWNASIAIKWGSLLERAKGNQDSRRRDAGYHGNKARDNDAQNFAMMAYSSSNLGSNNKVKSCSKTCEESYARLKKLYDEQRDKLGDASVEITAYTLALKKVEAQLLCHQQNQLAYEQKIRFMKINLDDKTDVLAYHKKLLAEALKEKEDLKTKIENWQNFSKNLSRLLNTQMSANDKFGLGYGDYRHGSILSYENEVLQSVFMNKERNYMPSGPDVEIDYSKFTYGPKQNLADESDSKPSEYASCESDSSVETTTSMHAPVDNVPKVFCEPKVWSDALIIEEYESDSDDDSVSNVQENKEKPSFAFTDSVKHVKPSSENVKETSTPNHSPKIKKHDRNCHTRKGLDTVMSDSEDSTITYTAMSSPFGGFSDIGSPGVDGSPIMPEDPYAYVVADFQASPSPDYVPGPEHPPSPVYVPEFVPEPTYPKFMPAEDDMLPTEEEPLPTAASPTTESPGYIDESDPDEDLEEDLEDDPEEDPTDYPADEEDEGDDKDESSDNDEDDDIDIEGDVKEDEVARLRWSAERGEILKVDLPLRKRLCTANTGTYDLGESYTAAAARLGEPVRDDLYSFVYTVEQEEGSTPAAMKPRWDYDPGKLWCCSGFTCMHTRSSSRLVSNPSSNPTPSTNLNPKGRNHKRLKQRIEEFNLDELSPLIVTMVDQRTMVQLLQAPTEGYEDAIVVPAITADNFELKHGLLTLVQNKQFFRHDKEDPHAHVRYFNKITSTLKFPNVLNTSIKLMIFLFSLEGATRIWLEKEPLGSIFIWDDPVSKFINQFFPPSKTTNLRNEITNFQQRFNESFSEAWDRFKDLLRACPHYGFSELHQLDTFYNAFNSKDQDSLNSAVGGNFLDKMPRKCLAIIESKSKVHYSRNKPVVTKVSTNTSTSGISPDVFELKDMVKALLLDKKSQNQAPAPVKAVKKTSAPQTQGVSKEDFSAYVRANDAVMRNMQTQGQNMQNQLTNLTELITKFVNSNSASTLSSGTLPSNTISNPRSDLKAITTRSEETKDTVQPTNNGSTEDVQPHVVQYESLILNSELVTSPIYKPIIAPVSAPKPNLKSSIPYPSRRNDERNREKANNQIEKFYQIFIDMSFKISFAYALILMPKFASTLKALIRNKEKLSEMARTPLNEHCSVVLLKKIPKNLGDPGKFLIPCDFPGMAKCLALADLGASIYLMPFSVWKRLSLPDLTPTCMTLELADRSISRPVRVAEDVYVKVGLFYFPADFVVVDFDADPRVPLILGRSFLKTERSLIDVFKDMACEEYSQEVLGFSDVISSGNPTPYYDLIVSTTSSTLTPFENSDFLLEEVNAFFTIEDDPTSPEVDQSYFDPEGDILLLESFLNDDLSLPPPS